MINNQWIEIVHPRMNEAINDIQIEEEEEEKESFINTNQTFQNEILFSGQNQMISPEVQQKQKILELVGRTNEIAQNPITKDELTGNFTQDLSLIVGRIAESVDTKRHSGVGRASSKIGMNELANLILNLQRDVKRVSKAISPDGAEDMVKKHNADKAPESHWKFVHRDINEDGIPDVLITNSKNQPIYVNGYTTTKSDYPMRYHYYKDLPPGSKERKEFIANGGTMSDYGRRLFEIKYNDDFDGNLHDLGKITSYQMPAVWKDYHLSNYKGVPLEKHMPAFERFKKYVLGDKFKNVFDKLE